MAAQQEVFTPLNELDITHSGRSVICVKVFVKWTQSYFNNPKEIASHDMILIDQEGNKIVATVKKYMYENTFSQTVLEGKYLRIENFGVQPYKGSYKLVDHGFKNKKEKVEEDVEQKSIDFIMCDVSGKHVKCTVWGEHADQVTAYVRAHLNDETPRVIMIHNGKLGKFVGAPQVLNQHFGCRIFKDESIGPIKEFISKLNQNDEDAGSVPKFADKDFGTDRKTALDEYKVKGVPIVHVDGIRFLSEEIQDGSCVTKAEVKKIFSEMGWFNYACKNCHEKLGNKVMGPGGEWVHYFSTCSGNTTDVFHKLRMTIQVADKSGSATFVVANPTVVPDDIGIILLKEIPIVLSEIGEELEAKIVQNDDLNYTPSAKVPASNNTDGTDVTPSSASLKRKSESNDVGSSGSYKAVKNLETLNIARMGEINCDEDSEAVE
ncbi:uncharacterized protein [Rutidosis leptorrhynchoides]|uniref:uncharacterized protein n=1 Tax=Rutidosis leptorrhynchoides TaxID=125765 RepID=UPI003A98F193